jgi:hypothetical protein
MQKENTVLDFEQLYLNRRQIVVEFLKSNLVALRTWKIGEPHRDRFLALADLLEAFLKLLGEKDIPEDEWTPGGLSRRR